MFFLKFLNRATGNFPRQLLLFSCFTLPWIMLSAPLMKFSPWPYGQPPFISLVSVSFFLSVGLCLCSLSEDQEKFSPALNYASIICLGITVWSFIASFFSYVPWLSWTGSPQIGMGIIWYIILSVMIIGYKLALNSKYLGVFITNVIVASFTICCLSFIGDIRHGLIPQFKGTPYFINEHIVFIGISLMGIGFSLDSKVYKKILLFLGILIIIASTNRTAFIGIAIGTFLYGIAYYINKKENFISVYSRYFFAAFIFLISPFVYLIAKYISSDFFLFSLHARYHFWRVCIDALINDPFRLLVGFGWGSYTDIILSSIHNMPIQIIRSDFRRHSSEIFLPYQSFPQNWSEIGLEINNLLIGNVGFHSHNQLIETLISCGIPGAILFSALLILPVLLCQKSKIPSMTFCCAALSFTFSGWYEIPGTLPYLAIFLAAVSPNISLKKTNFKYFFQFSLACISVILLVFGLSLIYFNLCFDTVREKFSSNNQEKTLSITVQDYLQSSGPGGIYLAIFLRDFLESVHSHPSLNSVDIKVLHNLLYASQKIKNPSLVMLSSELPLYDFLMNQTQDPRLNSLKEMLLHHRWWEKRLSILTQQWYPRVDLIFPYFDWQIQQGRKKLVGEIIKNILEKKGYNPILLNYSKSLGVSPLE
jgi:hypothetical protein